MSELLHGKIATLQVAKPPTVDEKTGKVTGKWITYDIAFTDGSTAKVVHAVDNQPLEVGDEIECTKGRFGGWVTNKVSWENKEESSPAEKPKSGKESEEKKQPYVRQNTNDRENYWAHKADYEEKTRDPKIEFQSYFTQVMSLYSAAVPVLAPTSVEELDGLIDQAYDKAKAIYKKVNLKE